MYTQSLEQYLAKDICDRSMLNEFLISLQCGQRSLYDIDSLIFVETSFVAWHMVDICNGSTYAYIY